MDGRPANVAAALQDVPVPILVPKVVGLGFDGIWVDRYGCADDGRDRFAFLHQISYRFISF